MYVAIILHTFVMIFAFAIMACFPATNESYQEAELSIAQMSRFGKVLFGVLTCLDVFMLGMGLYVILSQIARSSLTISMAFAMAFNFDAEFSVDIFQILAALLIPVDLTSEI